jgi:hypothetical protein
METINNSIAALQAASAGRYVFPCTPGGKEPALRGSWYEHATTDTPRVFQWWSDRPDYNIGISAKKSGLLVVDCDMPKPAWKATRLKGTPHEWIQDKYGTYIDGLDCFRAIVERVGADWAETCDTYSVQTPSMGLHLYYAWPGHVRASQASPVPGLLDVRTNGGDFGGYVLGAGSRTPEGPYICETDRPVRDCPPWLVSLVRAPAPVRPQHVQQKDLWSGSSGLVDTVRNAGEGNRNSALHWAACCMRDDGRSQPECKAELLWAARQTGLTEREIIATIRSAYRKGA